MNKITKIVCLIVCVVLAATLCSSFVGCKKTPRDEILKLYLPEGYIDEDTFTEFEAWYEEQTGKKITVKLETFETVEDIQLAVEGSKADYDILCPSDYMVEYLKDQGLLQKVDKTKLNIAEEGLFESKYIDIMKNFDANLEYSVPYMFGTLGLIYDYTKTQKHIDSWEALYGNEFAGRRSVKKSIHESYVTACLYNARNETATLEGGALKAKIQEIFEDTSDATIAAAKNTLLAVKNGGAEWDVDNIKYEMAAGTTDVAVGLMYSCDAGYVMNDYEDDEGNEHPGCKNLWYVVPKEGGNIYIDCFVINAYAGNTEAAQYFLQFSCLKDIAVKNSFYAGCISPVKAAYDELYEYYTEDEDGLFENVSDEWKAMYIETMFPSEETLNRCGSLKDFGDQKSAVSAMWKSIK